MPDHVTPFSSDQVGHKAVRFSSTGVFATHKDHMVDPYAATRIPKEHQIQGFYYWPREADRCPAIVLLHDKWGLTPDAGDLAVRLAREGYVVITPNLYGRQGGMVTSSAEVADALAERLDRATALRDINASCEFLNANLTEDPTMDVTLRNAHAVVGLGLGGTLAIPFAFERKRLRAAVSFYGALPDPIDAVGALHCPLLYHAAGAQAPATDAELTRMDAVARDAGKIADVRRYADAGPGFFDAARPSLHHASSARQAWEDTVAFLTRHIPPVTTRTASPTA